MTRKTAFFKGWSWFKFNSFKLVQGTNLKFYTSVAKRLKLKLRKFWGLILIFAEVTEGKLVGRSFCSPPPILNRVKDGYILQTRTCWEVPLIKEVDWCCHFSSYSDIRKIAIWSVKFTQVTWQSWWRHWWWSFVKG